MKHSSGPGRVKRKSRWTMLGDAFVNGIGFVGGVAFTIFIVVLVIGGFHK